MNRHFNYTGRRRINRDEIKLSTGGSPGQPLSFKITIDLKRLSLPSDADVVLDAYQASNWQRVSLGKVATKIEKAGTFDQFSFGQSPLFNLTVVDSSTRRGRVLASARQLKAGDGPNVSLLNISTADLKGEIYKVLFLDGEPPTLLIEQKLDDSHDAGAKVLSRDPRFFGLIYPPVLRLILMHYLSTRSEDEDEEPTRSWRRLGESMVVRELPEEIDDRVDWIDDVVGEFARRNDVVNAFVAAVAK